MVYLTIRCDPLPGREDEFDRLLTQRSKEFWTGQPGVKSYRVYGDKLLGFPERTIMIEVEDFGTLQRILDADEHRPLRKEFMTHVARIESQILDAIV